MKTIHTLTLAKRLLSGIAGVTLGIQAGCAQGSGDTTAAVRAGSDAQKAEVGTIVDVAEGAGSFSTLLTAVRAAGLEETLRTAQALTVFAPTDEAFAALPEGALDALLQNPEQLKNVLLYHVVDGNVPSSVAVTLSEASMLNGGKTSIKYDGMTLFINDAKVVTADVGASNGIIHVIDKVLLPPAPMKDLISTAEAAGQFTTLLTAVRAAGLEDTLRQAKDVTLFAPSDSAFAKIPADTLNALLADKEALKNVLLYHVVGARVTAATAATLSEATMLNGDKIRISRCGKGLKINDSNVIAADVEGGNGLIHVLDAVLIP